MPNLKPRRQVSPEMAVSRLEALCARAEHCSSEMRDKLWQWQIPADEAEKILSHLIARKFVDDFRYARAVVNDKIVFSRWGRRKVINALSVKRIPHEAISRAIETIDTSVYEQNLRHLLTLKAASLPHGAAHSYEGRTKLFRFAVSRGYEPELAARLIRGMFA